MASNMADLLISPVKRERLKRKEKARKKAEMRAQLPVYTREEVRRYRLPLHEAIFIELHEQNLISSAAFLKQLVDYQEWMRESSGRESKVWAKPRIIDRDDVLTSLSEGFKAAEKAHYANDFATEIDHFLHLCVKYAFGTNDWWWLGEQLMIQCNRIAKRYEGDGHRRYAISEYIFGRFLFENLLDRDNALIHLNNARKSSMGHSWTAAKYLLCVQKTVFVECCIVLYRTLLDEAKDMMEYDSKGAIKLCIRAKRRAYDACVHDGEAKAMLLEGSCHMLIDQFYEAAQCFYKVLLMQTKAKKIQETCEARIWLVRAYLKLGHWEESYAHLQKLLECALENNLPYYVGQAYRYLGEYYLNHGNPNLATPLLLKAIGAFHEIGDVNNREQVKNFAAVSAGQELMPKYIRYIVKSGEPGQKGWKYLTKLLEWKDTRKIVWSESDITLHHMMSFDSVLSQAEESGENLLSILGGEDEMETLEEITMDTTTGSTELKTEGPELKTDATEMKTEEQDLKTEDQTITTTFTKEMTTQPTEEPTITEDNVTFEDQTITLTSTVQDSVPKPPSPEEQKVREAPENETPQDIVAAPASPVGEVVSPENETPQDIVAAPASPVDEVVSPENEAPPPDVQPPQEEIVTATEEMTSEA